MKLDALERYLNSFGRQVINQAKANLASADKGGELEKSIGFFVTADKGLITVKFKMLPYGKFVDKGVSGTENERSYTNYKGKTEPSPFKYTTKGPPIDILSKWIKRKGIKGHGAKKGRSKKTGQFVSGLAYLISKSIKKKGIQGISFFQKPLMLGMQEFSGKFGASLKESIIDNLKHQKIIS
tara:strand:+ start:1051 stop:1596 length:546 start_codon:yes stop_codon:yes gene_type:complete